MAPLSGTGVRRAPMVVGREAELDRLRRAVTDAHRGRASSVFLVGEGGVGKTRLLAAVADEARHHGLAVLSGRAPVTSPVAFSVIAEALRSWLRGQPAPAVAPPFDAGLALVLPELHAPAGAGLTGSQLRLLALEGVVHVVRAVATRNQGAVLTLDDLHAADAESLETIRYLATAAPAGLLIVGALRPQDGPMARDVVRALAQSGAAQTFDLEPLDRRAVGDLLAALLDAGPPEELVADVVARTDGVPLLVEEVLAAHLRAATVVVDGAGAHWRGGAAAVPRPTRDVVAGRLARLTHAQQEVVVAAAIAGDFDVSLLSAASGQPRDAVGDAIAAAVDAGLVEGGGGGVMFRHAVVREAVVDTALPHVQVALHRRLATALAALSGTDPARLERQGHHLLAAGEPEDAAALLAAAARGRLSEHALLGAEALARAALDASSSSPDAADALAAVLAAQGRWAEALAADEAATSRLGETPARWRRMAWCAAEAGRAELAASLLARAVALGDESPEAGVLSGRLALASGDAARGLAAADRALAAAMSAGDTATACAALDVRARTLDYLGRREEAKAAWTRQADVAAAAGLTDARLRAVVQLGKLELFEGRSGDRLREAVELTRAAGALVEQAWAEENLAISLTLRGDPAGGERVAQEAAARCRELRLDALPYLLVSTGGARSIIGERAEAFALFDEADALAPTDDMRLHTMSLRADTELRHGNYEAALGWFERALDVLRRLPANMPTDTPFYFPVALMAAGREAEAGQALEAARAIPDLTRWHGRPTVLAAAEAIVARSPAAFDAAILAGDTATRMPLDSAELCVVAADVMGPPHDTRWLLHALDLYENMGAAPFADRTRRLLRQAGGPVPRQRRARAAAAPELARDGVTAREGEVLGLVQEGLSNAAIAERLYLSVRTVETHVSSLLSKLGVESRAQLIARTAKVAD